MRKMMIMGAVLFATALSLPSAASAQTSTCECINGVKCYRLPDGSLHCDPGITCQGTFTVSPPIPATGRVASSAFPQSITARTNSPLGPATINLDPTRPPSQPSRLTSNGTARFPLTAEIRFNATATIDNLRGLPITNAQELVYKTTNANSVNPFLGETLVLQNDVDFFQGTQRVFTLRAGTSSINLGPDQGGD